MTPIAIRTVDDSVLRALAQLKLALPLNGSLKPALTDMGRVLKTAAQLRFRSQRGPDGTAWQQSRRVRLEGGQTLSLSGRLRRSLSVEVGDTSVAVGTNVIYAAVHQFGGVIRAKSGPFLAIPLTPAARAAGSPRKMPDLRVIQTLKGQYLMVNDQGPQFLLRHKVTMPARPFLGASDDDRAELVKTLQRHLQGAWQR